MKKAVFLIFFMMTVIFISDLLSVTAYAGDYDNWHIGYNWNEKSNFSVDQSDFYGYSDSSLVIDNPVYNDAYIERKFKVEPNSRYRFSAMVKCTGYSVEPDASGSTGASIGKAWSYDHSEFTVTDNWNEAEYIFETKNETEVTLCLRYGMFGSCCKGTAKFSNIKLEKDTSQKTNQWNILAVVFKNVNAKVLVNGEYTVYSDSLNNDDVRLLTTVLNNLYTSLDSISGGLMDVKSIDVVSTDTAITQLGRCDNGYMIDPDLQETQNLIKPFLDRKEYNQIIVISPISGIADGWAGLGGTDCLGISFCQINYSSGSSYFGDLNDFPEAVFVHEMLHGMESRSNEINPSKTAGLHDGEKYGFTDDGDKWRSWYSAYMRAELPGNKGLDPSVYWVYNDSKYKLISDDMTVDDSIRRKDSHKKAKSIDTLSFSSAENKVYTGSPCTTNFIISDGSYTLRNGVDYTVSYSQNIYPGKASATIMGIGEYSGTKSISFYILPKKVRLNARRSKNYLYLSWSSSPGADGYDIYYSTNGGKYKYLNRVSAEIAGCKIQLDLKSMKGNTYRIKISPYKKVGSKILRGKGSNIIKISQ